MGLGTVSTCTRVASTGRARQPLAADRAVSPPHLDSDGVSAGTAPPRGVNWPTSSPPQQRARPSALIGVAFGFGIHLGPALGGVLAEIDISLALLVASVAFLNLGAGGEGAAGDPGRGGPPGPAPQAGPFSPLCSSSGVFGKTPGARLCAAFFLFFLAFRRLHRRAGALISKKQALRLGPGPLGHRLR